MVVFPHDHLHEVQIRVQYSHKQYTFAGCCGWMTLSPGTVSARTLCIPVIARIHIYAGARSLVHSLA